MITTKQAPLSPKEIYGGFCIRLGSYVRPGAAASCLCNVPAYLLREAVGWQSWKTSAGVEDRKRKRGRCWLGRGRGETFGDALLHVDDHLSVGDFRYQVPNDVYYASNFIRRIQAISGIYPQFSFFLSVCTNIWGYSEFLVLLTNRKRKAIHDYIMITWRDCCD